MGESRERRPTKTGGGERPPVGGSTAVGGKLERHASRELHDARACARGWKGERRARLEQERLAARRAEGVVRAAHVVDGAAVEEVEGFGDELQARRAVDSDLARHAPVQPDLPRQAE